VARAALADRRRNLALRRAVRSAGDRLEEARSTEQVWSTVRSLAPALGASAVALKLTHRNARGVYGEWSNGFDTLPDEALRARFGLTAGHSGEDLLELGWTDGPATLPRDTEIAVELLCEHATSALARLEAHYLPLRPLEKFVSFHR
jgi:hypothetical protein